MVAGDLLGGDARPQLTLYFESGRVAGDGALLSGHRYSPRSIVGATNPTTGGITSKGTPFSPPFAEAT